MVLGYYWVEGLWGTRSDVMAELTSCVPEVRSEPEVMWCEVRMCHGYPTNVIGTGSDVTGSRLEGWIALVHMRDWKWRNRKWLHMRSTWAMTSEAAPLCSTPQSAVFRPTILLAYTRLSAKEYNTMFILKSIGISLNLDWPILERLVLL